MKIIRVHKSKVRDCYVKEIREIIPRTQEYPIYPFVRVTRASWPYYLKCSGCERLTTDQRTNERTNGRNEREKKKEGGRERGEKGTCTLVTGRRMAVGCKDKKY